MLGNLKPTSHVALATRAGDVTWKQLTEQVADHAKSFESFHGKRIALLLAPTPESLSKLLACHLAGVHVFLMAQDTPAEQATSWGKRFGLAAIFDSSDEVRAVDDASQTGDSNAITILTSGTTGEPKAVQHTWESLTRPVRPMDEEHSIWLLTYRPHLYAGLQVMMQCLLNQGCLVMTQPGDTADEVATLAANKSVEYASATPSYWRWLLTFASDESLGNMSLKQITLGGEAVDQATLDALHRKFPSTRLVHIYATTELGRCFSVTDGLAGFPSKFLNEVSKDGVEMKIDDGELVVRSANAMSGYDQSEIASPKQDWFHTGDLVSVEADRVFFVGRKTDMINVGGNKVYPLEVETVIRTVTGVADVRVYGEASSILGLSLIHI